MTFQIKVMKLLKITLVSVSLLVADTALASGSAVKPSAPVQISPANGAVDQPLTITVAWRTSKPGESYRVQVSTNASFSSTIVNQGGITTATGYTLWCLVRNKRERKSAEMAAKSQTTKKSYLCVCSYRIPIKRRLDVFFPRDR